MKRYWLALASVLVAGCSTLPDVGQRIDHAKTEAGTHGFTGERVSAGLFVLQAYHRGLDRKADDWHVYLEGDGQAFVARSKLSPDPTPVDPLALDLALVDPAPTVLYLARPCQYRSADEPGPCPKRYWSSHRFADDVVEATLAAIEQLLHAHGTPSTDITLIGYSGGGTLAALVAARSSKTRRLITVASPLDLAAWASHHGITPLDGSLDPVAIAPRLTMPQLHLTGERDPITPPALQAGFIAALPSDAPVAIVHVPDFDHACCWQKLWPSLLMNLPNSTR